MKITIDKAVLEQALDALNHGTNEMNLRGCAIECMPLHHSAKALREALAQPAAQPAVCQHQWFGTGAMDQSEARCILCGEWKLKAQPAAQPTDMGDSLFMCASDLQHSAIYDNHLEMQSCLRAVAARIIAFATQPAAQPTEPAGEPVAWDVYVAEHQRGYLIDSLDDPQYLDDATNHGAVATPLYTRPAVPLTDAQKQEIHNKTGAGHALICLVESYISEAHHKIGGTP